MVPREPRLRGGVAGPSVRGVSSRIEVEAPLPAGEGGKGRLPAGSSPSASVKWPRVERLPRFHPGSGIHPAKDPDPSSRHTLFFGERFDLQIAEVIHARPRACGNQSAQAGPTENAVPLSTARRVMAPPVFRSCLEPAPPPNVAVRRMGPVREIVHEFNRLHPGQDVVATFSV